MTLRHYVVQAKPCQDSLAHENIRALGFECHLLTTQEEIRTRLGRTTVEVPLFPGYLFVAMDTLADHWRPVALARGVQRILGADGEHPTPMPLDALDGLRRRFEAGEFTRQAPKPIEPGERLDIVGGPYMGRAGVCDMSQADRIRVLMNVLGGEAKVWLPIEWVARVPA